MSLFIRLIRTSIAGFLDDDCLTSGAAIAYYTIFSLPPLLVLVLSLTNTFGFSRQDVDHVIQHELGMPATQIDIGGAPQGAKPQSPPGDQFHFNLDDLGIVSSLLGLGLLLFSATLMFGELQYALNKVWRVAPDPKQGAVKSFLFKRLLSAGMLIAIWFVLLLSLILSAATQQVLRYLLGEEPGLFGQIVGSTVNELTTFVLAIFLFASVFKILPDAQLRWADVWVGAAVTALLFILGKIAIAWYLKSFQVGLSWGSSAASTAAALVWVYYSSLIVLFGAELTEAWSAEFGQAAPPQPGAVQIPGEKPRCTDIDLPTQVADLPTK